jgi:hypothetical protein
MNFGAFPGVVLEKNEEEKIYLLDELLNSYLAKEEVKKRRNEETEKERKSRQAKR